MPDWLHLSATAILGLASYPVALWLRWGGQVPAYLWEQIYNAAIAGLGGLLIGASLVDLGRRSFSPLAHAYTAAIVALSSVVFALASVYLLQVDQLPRLTFVLAFVILWVGLTAWQLWTHRTPPAMPTLVAEAVPVEQLPALFASAEAPREVLVLPTTTDVILACGQLVADGDKLLLQITPRACDWPATMLKRLVDVLASAAIIILTLPFWVAVAVAIRLDSRGPVFFRQARVGRKGKVFHIFKFRTMIEGAERLTGPVLAGRNDPRVTRVGRWLRTWRLDELPQLINVFKGDMSLVGPRPERPEFVEEFRREIPGYELRHLVRPGITGLAQVRGKYDTPAIDKLRFDLAYIFLWSPLLEVKILLQTISVMLTGALALPSHELPEAAPATEEKTSRGMAAGA